MYSKIIGGHDDVRWKILLRRSGEINVTRLNTAAVSNIDGTAVHRVALNETV